MMKRQKTGQQRQTQASLKSFFNETKGTRKADPHSIQDFEKKENEKLNNMVSKNGANSDNSTPFRSCKRLNKLMQPAQMQVVPGSSKPTQISPGNILKSLSQKEDYSKPSSVASAFTSATTVIDFPQMKKETQKMQKKNEPKKNQRKQGNVKLGKRQAEFKTELVEFFIRMPDESAGMKDWIKNRITLRNRKTGEEFLYRMVDNRQVYAKNYQLIKEFENKTKLEVEFDYDTDAEQIHCSRVMLLEDLEQAIEFFVKEDPIKLVSNVTRKFN